MEGQRSNLYVDKYRFVYLVYFWIGVCVLMPWNFFINASDYWMYKFRDTSENSSSVQEQNHQSSSKKYTELQLSWNSYLSISNMIPNLVTLSINAVFGHRMPVIPRLIGSSVLIIMLFAFNDVMTFVNTDNFQHGFLAATLATVIVSSTAVGILQGGLAATVARFPHNYMSSYFQGQALGGIVVAVVNILVIAIGSDPVSSAKWSFLVGTLSMASSLLCYVLSTKTTFYRIHQQDHEEGEGSVRESEPIVDEDPWVDAVDGDGRVEKSEVTTLFIMGKIWVYILVQFLVFMVTLCLFPTLTVLIESVNKGKGHPWNDTYFTPVGCFLLYNVGDYVGRLFAGVFKWPWTSTSIPGSMLAIAVARLSFIPLFLFCNASPNNRATTDVYIHSDTTFLVLMLLFSVSNGYVQTMAMMYGPKIMPTPKDQGRAASILVFFLMSGLTTGALLSAPLLKLL